MLSHKDGDKVLRTVDPGIFGPCSEAEEGEELELESESKRSGCLSVLLQAGPCAGCQRL